ncbi:MAG: hypothetical protein ABIW96_06470, partial [Polaromonas sp.]
DAGGLHTNRFSKSNHRHTSYRDLLRDLLGDEDELGQFRISANTQVPPPQCRRCRISAWLGTMAA